MKSLIIKYNKKNLISLILRIHVLILCLIVVLWSRNQLKNKPFSSTNKLSLERKAQFLLQKALTKIKGKVRYYMKKRINNPFPDIFYT